jgi:hypothetical protein
METTPQHGRRILEHIFGIVAVQAQRADGGVNLGLVGDQQSHKSSVFIDVRHFVSRNSRFLLDSWACY